MIGRVAFAVGAVVAPIFGVVAGAVVAPLVAAADPDGDAPATGEPEAVADAVPPGLTLVPAPLAAGLVETFGATTPDVQPALAAIPSASRLTPSIRIGRIGLSSRRFRLLPHAPAGRGAPSFREWSLRSPPD